MGEIAEYMLNGDDCQLCGEYFADGACCGGAMGNAEHDGWNRGQIAGGNGASVQHNAQGANGTGQPTGAGESCDVAYTDKPGSQGRKLYPERTCEWAAGADGLEWIACPDGKGRPVEPGLCLLAHGVQHRAPLLHGYGNAIVPQVAAAFIKATRECLA